MISSTVVAPFICLLAVPTTADLLRPFHRPEADPGAFFDVSRSLETGKPLKISNLCPDVIYPGIVTQHGVGPESHGFELKPGTSRQMVVSPDWFGRVWGRTNCSFNAEGTGASNRDVLYGGGKACVTGDCNGMLDCRVSGDPPVTLSEILLKSEEGRQSFYDISLVDGYNLPMGIVVLPSDTADVLFADIPPNVSNPACVASAAFLADRDYDPYLTNSSTVLGTNNSYPMPFESQQTRQYVSRWCPWDLLVDPATKPHDGVYSYPDSILPRPTFAPCYSACAKDNAPHHCCTGEYEDRRKCKPTLYNTNAKAICPDAYSYAFDDDYSTFVLPSGFGFEVVFCPSGRSTNILATHGAKHRKLGQLPHGSSVKELIRRRAVDTIDDAVTTKTETETEVITSNIKAGDSRHLHRKESGDLIIVHARSSSASSPLQFSTTSLHSHGRLWALTIGVGIMIGLV